MTITKYGVSPSIEHEELLNEEAQLMTKIASVMEDPEEVKKLEGRLHAVRGRITAIDKAESILVEVE